MKKNKIIFITVTIISIIVLALTLFLVFKKDKLPFENDVWIRTEDDVTEIIKLRKDNTFEYITTGKDTLKLEKCTEYTYNKKTKIISLKCNKKAKIDEIKVIDYSNNELILKIDKNEHTYQVAER